MPRYIIPSSHRVTKAKERLAAAKLHNAISVERLGSANLLEQSSKAALELAQKSMETAIRNKEEAIEQLRITQKEMKEAEQTLAKAEQEKNTKKKNQTMLHQTNNNNTAQKYGVGTAVSKEFYDKDIDKFRSFSGKVISYNINNMLYRIRYEDDDEEDLSEKKLAKIVIGKGISSKQSKKRKRSTELASNDKNPKAKKKNSSHIKKEGQKSIEYCVVNLAKDHPIDLFKNGYHIQVKLNDNHPPWRATIIKRREKLGVLGYDIHYHGLAKKTKHWIKYDKIVAVHFPKEDDKKTSEEDLSKEVEEEEETSETTSP